MRIQKVIHASNDEPFYLDFWPIVSKIWKLKFGIEPILLYFGNQIVDETYGTVIKMNIIDNVPINTQCQIARYWIPVTEPETVWMTSDIDMLPISRDYFIDQLEQISDDKFVNLNANRGENYPHINYPCCYNVAKGKVFTDILQLNSDWKQFVDTGFWKENTHDHKPEGLTKTLSHWGADEMWSSRMINKYDQSKIVRLYRSGGQNGNRIDRLRWKWDNNNFPHYIDSHCIRPYSQYKDSIDTLVNLIMK